MLFLKIYHKIKSMYKTKIFHSSAKIGNGTIFGEQANCTNSGGEIIIGSNCDIHCRIIAKKDSIIKIGDYTTIRGHSIVGAVNNIEIGNHVIISNNVTIYDNNNHPISPSARIQMTKSGFYSTLWDWENASFGPIIIEDNVWIGEKSTILKGVRIGRGSIVGCNSVVTKDVPEYSIVAGNPAKVVKRIESKV